MERVTDHDGVRHAVVERDRLRGAVEDIHGRQADLDQRAHVPRRLHRHHYDAEGSKPLRQLPRAGREIEDERALPEPTSLPHPGDRFRRIARPEGVVVVGVDYLEAEPGSHGLTS